MSRILFVLSMLIFSSIGVFVDALSVPSSVTALFRSVFGTAILLLVILFTGKKLDKKVFLSNARYLIPAGIFLGINWVLLFEGYKMTGVATATLCYYLAPAIVIILSPIVLREKPGFLKILCAFAAFLGMIPVSGILNKESEVDLGGIAVSLGAALLYAAIVLLNKKLKNISGIETTVIQLGISSIVMLLYVFISVPLSAYENYLSKDILTLLILGVVHTGVAYLLYFTSIKSIKASDAALFSYIDPAGALIFSYTLLEEEFTWMGLLGIVIILGASILAQLPSKKSKPKPKRDKSVEL